MVKAEVTTVLDVLGLLLIAGGSGWGVKSLIPGGIGWAAGVIVVGILILAGSWVSDFLMNEKKG